MNALKASRSEASPNRELRGLLEILKLLPPEAKLPDLNDALLLIWPQVIESDFSFQLATQVHSILRSIFIAFPIQFQTHLWRSHVPADWLELPSNQRSFEPILTYYLEGPSNEPADFFNLFEDSDDREQSHLSAYWGAIEAAEAEYAFIRESRENLLKLISFVGGRGELPSRIVTHTNLVVKDGKVGLDNDRFARALDDVDAWRIRQCPICGRIFWAPRKNQSCCTPPCAHRLRNRRYRARYLTSYKFKRSGEKPLQEVEQRALEAKQVAVRHRQSKKG